MKTKQIIRNWLLPGILITIPTVIYSQDDLYYFPSKDKENPSEKIKDTSGMSDYEKYRALKESQKNTVRYYEPNEEETQQQETNTDSNVKPSSTVVYKDSTNGNVIVNNYYYDDDRFANYRRFYFDYYDPYYDLYWWPYYGWNGWYVGFYSSWYYPYSWSWYWCSPYWYYSPYYYSYYHGYYDGFYNGYYYQNNTYRTGDVYIHGGRRIGSFSSTKVTDNSYYAGKYLANDLYHGTQRRNPAVPTAYYSSTTQRSETSYADNKVPASTRTRVVSTINTTKPILSNERKYTSYTPTYQNPSNNEINRRYTPASRNVYYGADNSNNARVYQTTRTRSNGTNTTVTPRRSNQPSTTERRHNSNTERSYTGNKSNYTTSPPSNISSGGNNGTRSTNQSGGGRRR